MSHYESEDVSSSNEEQHDSSVVDALPHPLVAMEPLPLPEDKKYFRIAEASAVLSVEPHVLRAWEAEFRSVRPERHGGQRVYRRKDVELLGLIRHMIQVEGYTLREARAAFRDRRRAISWEKEQAVVQERTAVLEEIQAELRELVSLALHG